MFFTETMVLSLRIEMCCTNENNLRKYLVDIKVIDLDSKIEKVFILTFEMVFKNIVASQ